MALLAIVLLGLALWAYTTGRLQRLEPRHFAAIALVLVGLRLLMTGESLPGLALAGAGAGIWIVSSRKARPASMPLEEALALLGLSRNAGVEEIRAAHRRLIARVHPDLGGNEELARRINAARDIAISATKRKVGEQ